MGTSKDLYRLLELPRGASREDVRKAHRRLVREYHPDANPGDTSAEERFKELQHAYEVLSHPRKRREYDEVLLRTSSRGEGLSHLVRKLVDLFNNLCELMESECQCGSAFPHHRWFPLLPL